MCIGSASTTGFMVSYMTFLFSVFVLSTLSYDSHDNGMSFLMSLPVERKTYVKEKYLFAVFLSLGSWITSLLVKMVFFLFRPSGENMMEFIYSSPIFLVMALVFLGYSLPIHLKYGSEKGHFITFGILGAAGLGIFSFIRFTDSAELIKIFHNITDRSPGSIMACLSGFCIIFWALSYRISLKIMEKKEF